MLTMLTVLICWKHLIKKFFSLSNHLLSNLPWILIFTDIWYCSIGMKFGEQVDIIISQAYVKVRMFYFLYVTYKSYSIILLYYSYYIIDFRGWWAWHQIFEIIIICVCKTGILMPNFVSPSCIILEMCVLTQVYTLFR